MTLTSINPATGQLNRSYDENSPEQVDAKISKAVKAFSAWRGTSFNSRAAILERVADLLLSEKDRWSRLMVAEMGKTKISAIAEIEKCAKACRYYAVNGQSFLEVKTVATGSAVHYLPLGVILAIMPWNYPFWQVFRFLAPTLMAGNVGLLKHASNVPGCAMAIEEITRRAGTPEGVFQTLLLSSSRIANVVSDARVAAVTLTGSEAAGAKVASLAGASLKKCVLELGGNDPFVVMPSADLKEAVKTAVEARIVNNGQSCVCAKRFIVHRDIYKRFESDLVSSFEALKVGDPMNSETDLGPLATADGVETLQRQVDLSINAGAQLLTGGRRFSSAGYYFQPTALANIPRDAPVYRDEVFGPVALLFEARDFDHALQLANDTPFGLGSSIWTTDPDEQRRSALGIDAGLTFVNSKVVSDPRMPFGGIKMSGYGRELGVYGIREFMNVKTVVGLKTPVAAAID